MPGHRIDLQGKPGEGIGVARHHAIAKTGNPKLRRLVGIEEYAFWLAERITRNLVEDRRGSLDVRGMPQAVSFRGEECLAGIGWIERDRGYPVQGIYPRPVSAAVAGAVKSAEAIGRPSPPAEHAYIPSILIGIGGIDNNILRPVEHARVGHIVPRSCCRVVDEDAGARRENRGAVPGEGANHLAIVEGNDGGGMSLGARRGGQLGPCGGSAILNVIGYVYPA